MEFNTVTFLNTCTYLCLGLASFLLVVLIVERLSRKTKPITIHYSQSSLSSVVWVPGGPGIEAEGTFATTLVRFLKEHGEEIGIRLQEKPGRDR